MLHKGFRWSLSWRFWCIWLLVKDTRHFRYTQMLFYSTAAQNPTYPAGTDVNGNWVKNSAASHINHPGALLYEKNDSEERNFNTHLGLKFNILDNLILFGFRLLFIFIYGKCSILSYMGVGARQCLSWRVSR